jgi:hypothetical protein
MPNIAVNYLNTGSKGLIAFLYPRRKMKIGPLSRTKRTTGSTRGRIGPLVRDVRPLWASLGNHGLCPRGSIPIFMQHRFENPGNIPLQIIEVQNEDFGPGNPYKEAFNIFVDIIFCLRLLLFEKRTIIS